MNGKKNVLRRCNIDVRLRQTIMIQNQELLKRLQKAGVTVISLSENGAHITRKVEGGTKETWLPF